MNIRIKSSLRKKNPATAGIKKKIERLLRTARLPDAELSIFFVGDRAMRKLNYTWRGKDRTTDVLSFAFREGAFSSIQPNALGDIVISLPTARRQARELGHSLSREIDRLLVHGFLHLLGFDHERGSREAQRMERKEAQLLKELS